MKARGKVRRIDDLGRVALICNLCYTLFKVYNDR